MPGFSEQVAFELRSECQEHSIEKGHNCRGLKAGTSGPPGSALPVYLPVAVAAAGRREQRSVWPDCSQGRAGSA